MYQVFNDIALKNEIVIFGSTYTAKFPFYEVARKYYLDSALYNRSIEGITTAEAAEILNECVIGVKPSKIFLALGECDKSCEETISSYGKIISEIKNAIPSAQIYALSIPGGKEELNESLKTMCKNEQIDFISVDYSVAYASVFKQLSIFFRKGKIDFCDAFKIS